MMRSYRHGLLLAASLAAVTFVGCSSTPAPTAGAAAITTQPASTTVVSGGGATFTIAATGNGTLSYQWRKDGTGLAGANAASPAPTAGTPAHPSRARRTRPQ